MFVRSFYDDGVSIAHHGDQHVEKQDGDQDLEENEDGLRHGGVVALLDVFILREERLVQTRTSNLQTSYSPSVMWNRAIQVVG